jgi:hypothetical protein
MKTDFLRLELPFAKSHDHSLAGSIRFGCGAKRQGDGDLRRAFGNKKRAPRYENATDDFGLDHGLGPGCPGLGDGLDFGRSFFGLFG